MESTITAKGRTTIPKAIRTYLGLAAGDRVKFLIRPDVTVAMAPSIPITAMRGRLKSRGPAASLEEIDEAPTAGAAERYATAAKG